MLCCVVYTMFFPAMHFFHERICNLSQQNKLESVVGDTLIGRLCSTPVLHVLFTGCCCACGEWRSRSSCTPTISLDVELTFVHHKHVALSYPLCTAPHVYRLHRSRARIRITTLTSKQRPTIATTAAQQQHRIQIRFPFIRPGYESDRYATFNVTGRSTRTTYANVVYKSLFL